MPNKRVIVNDKVFIDRVEMIKLRDDEPPIYHYRVWEKIPVEMTIWDHPYSSITFIDHVLYGQVGSDTKERNQEAIDLICKHFPEAIHGEIEDNEIIYFTRGEEK